MSADPSFYRCPTGKRIFYKEHLANRAITEAARRGELDPLRHYECPECGHWHLSRKDRGMKPKMSMRLYPENLPSWDWMCRTLNEHPDLEEVVLTPRQIWYLCRDAESWVSGTGHSADTRLAKSRSGGEER